MNEDGVILKINADKIGIYRNNISPANNFVEVYPNPTGNILNIPVVENVSIALVSIYNSMGQLVIQKEIQPGNIIRQSAARINVIGLAKGIYFGNVTSNRDNLNFTFVKN